MIWYTVHSARIMSSARRDGFSANSLFFATIRYFYRTVHWRRRHDTMVIVFCKMRTNRWNRRLIRVYNSYTFSLYRSVVRVSQSNNSI